jgi:branched-chain amino acid transport system substrate-binding protein
MQRWDLSRREFARGLGSLSVFSSLAQYQAARAAVPRNSSNIVLGQSAAFSGPAMGIGSALRDGAGAYFRVVNMEGGIGGRTIDVIALDDGYEPDRTKANTEQFLKNPEVLALFGYVGTPTTLAALPMLSARQMPLVGPYTGARSVRQPLNPLVFNIRASYDDETEKMIDLLTVMGHTKVGVFRQNDAFGEAGMQGVQQALAKRKLKLEAEGKVERNSVNVLDAVNAFSKSGATAIIMVSAYASSAAFVKAMRARGQQQTFSSVSFVGSSALRSALGKAGAGVQIAQVVPSPWDMRFPVVREYQRDMKKAGASELEFDFASLEGYITARVIVDALRRANGNYSSSNLVSALEKTQWESGGFSIAFGPQKRIGSSFVEMTAISPDGRFDR